MPPLTTSRRAAGRFVVVALVLSAVGCGGDGKVTEGKSFPVEGMLRYKDGTDCTDLGGGTLELEVAGKVVALPIASDGTVNRDEKLPAGKHRARVVPPPPRPDAEYTLDARFRQFDTSGLTVTITDEDRQRINLTLTRTPRPNRS